MTENEMVGWHPQLDGHAFEQAPGDGQGSLLLLLLSCFSCARLFVTLWTVACQEPLSMGFSRQEYWSRLPFPPPGALPNPRIEPFQCRGCGFDPWARN